jgi:hypothetical protein
MIKSVIMDSFGTFVRRVLSEERSEDDALARIMTRIRAIPAVAIGGHVFSFRLLPYAVARDAVINAKARNSEGRDSITENLEDSIFQAEDIEDVIPYQGILCDYLRSVKWFD